MSRSDMNDLAKALKKAGYTTERNRKNHHRVWSNGIPMDFPSTPSDGRGIQNAIAELRRRGYVFNFRGKSINGG